MNQSTVPKKKIEIEEDTKNKYKRVIVIDPQMKDTLGHNYRYAYGIKNELGCETVVVANRDFKSDFGDLTVHPNLSFDQYDNSAFKTSIKLTPLAKLERLKEIVAGKVEALSGVWPRKTPLGKTLSIFSVIAGFLCFSAGLVYQLVRFLTGYGSSAHRDAAALQLKESFKELQVGKGDLVVFQTMLWPTFESLLELNIHIENTFECDAFFIVHEDWRIYHSMYGRFSPLHFEKRVLESLPFVESKVVVTNQSLQQHCQEWCGFKPEVIEELNSFTIPLIDRNQSDSSTCLRLLVPGVYRGDKSFEIVPRLLAALGSSLENVQVTLHSSVLNTVSFPPYLAERISIYSNIAEAGDWLRFIGGFDAVLIPYGDEYKNRISGILHECKLLGVPVICRRVINDSVYINVPQFVLEDSREEESFPVAIKKLGHLAPDEVLFVNHESVSLPQAVYDQNSWVKRIEKPIAIHLKPAWTRCGTSVVLDHQNEMLVKQGYFVVEIYLKAEAWSRTPDQVEFLYKVAQGGRINSAGMVGRVLLKDIKFSTSLSYALKKYRKKFSTFMERESKHIAWCELDTTLSAFLERNKIELLFVNHVFNAEFGFSICKPKYSVCETHDIQINQLLKRRPELQSNYGAEFDYEMSLLKQFDSVINLNTLEHLIIKDAIGAKAKYIRPPIYKWPSDLKYKTFKELVADQGEYNDFKLLPDKIDLLIIADGHPANIDSVKLFIEEVYLKLPSTVSLAVVGSVCKYLELEINDVKSKNLFYVGFLEQISNVYDFARFVILPDMAGEGIPIKTDEAIANGANLVATEKALRGFTSIDLMKLSLTPLKSTDEMYKLLSDKLESFCGDLQFVEYKLPESFSLTKYHYKWAEVLNSITGPKKISDKIQ